MYSKPAWDHRKGHALHTPSYGSLLGLGRAWAWGLGIWEPGNTTGHEGSCSPLSPVPSLPTPPHCFPYPISTLVARPSHYPEIRRLFPQAQIQTVPNAGHWVHNDNPKDFMDAVTSFLA